MPMWANALEPLYGSVRLGTISLVALPAIQRLILEIANSLGFPFPVLCTHDPVSIMKEESNRTLLSNHVRVIEV